MESPNPQPKLVAAMLKEHAERVGVNADLQKRIRENNARRAAIGNKYREEVFRKGLAAAGIDYEEILKRQAKETESLGKEVAKLTADYKATGEQVKARHEQWSRKILAKPAHVIRKRGPAMEAVILGSVLKPDSATFEHTGGDGSVQAVPTGNSLLRFQWATLIDGFTQGSSNQHFSATATFTFSWTPETDGLLGVVVPVTYNGFQASLLNPSCWDWGSNDVQMDTTVRVAQDLGDQTDYAAVSPTPFHTDWGQFGGPYCLGAYKAEVVDNTQLFETNQPLAVFASWTVQVIVIVEVNAWTYNGGLNVDFSTEGRAITLPGVLFGLTPE